MKYFHFVVLTALLFCMTAGLAYRSQGHITAKAVVTGVCTLNGSGSYDPNPGGHIKSYHWRKVAGPSCRIVSPNSAITGVSGLTKGVYLFQLMVVSSENLSAKDSTTVTVKVN